MENSWIDLAIVHRAKDCQVFSEAKRKIDIVHMITKNYERCSTFYEFVFIIWYVCASGISITNTLIISEARREIVNEITIAISRISAVMHVGAISLLQSLTSFFWDKEQSPRSFRRFNSDKYWILHNLLRFAMKLSFRMKNVSTLSNEVSRMVINDTITHIHE